MNKQREALDALEGIHPGNMTPMAEQAWNKAINAIREALAEPEQEPVAWTTKGQIAAMDGGFQRYIEGRDPRFVLGRHDDVPLYTSPPARKPLTDEEISAVVQSMSAYTWDAHMLARAIERAHEIGEK